MTRETNGWWGIPGLRRPEACSNEKGSVLSLIQEEMEKNVFEVRLARQKGSITAGTGVAEVRMDFTRWAESVQVLLPGSVYGGNRFRARCVPYPPIFKLEEDLRKDLPITVTDIARLNIMPGESRLERNTNDLATPAIGLYWAQEGIGCWLLLRSNLPGGPIGIVLAESEDRSKATLTLRIPSHNLEEVGSERDETAFLRAHVFACSGVTDWIGRFAPIRKSFSEPQTLPSEIPFSAAWNIVENKFNDLNWESDQKYYSVGLRENHFQDWQCGWVGGGISTYPLLAIGSELSSGRAKQTIDFMFGTQAESGFFHGIYSKGQYPGDGFDREDAGRWHLVRKSGDVLYFLLKQLIGIEKNGEIVPAAWKVGARKLADAFVRLWEREGQFGQFIDIYTGEIIVGGSTAGAIVPAGLTLAAEYWREPKYAEVARLSAAMYVNRDLRSGVTTGGPGEILQCPDSESAFALLESLIVLYEATGEREWLDAARDAATLAMTWCVSYDFIWPERSEFGRLGMKTTGTVIANAQNRHSAPGICTLSGDSLLKLFRATGDPAWLELLRDIARTLPQYMSRADRPIASWDEHPTLLPPGFVNERVNISAWEGEDKVGGVFNGSCWSETALILSILEVPGLYVQPDTGLFAAIDHIHAERVEEAEGGGVKLRLRNDTSFSAAVRVLTERSSCAGQPLKQKAAGSLPVIPIEPGASAIVFFHEHGFEICG